MKYWHVIAIATAFCWVFSTFACGVTAPDEFVPEVIVESYLFAADPLPEVRLSKTVPIGTAYIFEEQGVADAAVHVRLLAKDGSVERNYLYSESGKGVYQPPATNDVVLPARVYALEIILPEDDAVLGSKTIVPDTFSVVSASNDSVVFQDVAQLEADITRSFYPGRQNIFILSVEALDARLEQLTPFRRELLEEEEHSLEDFRIDESFIINEANFDLNPNGTIAIKIPWLAIAFYGPNKIKINAIDDNVLDFIRSQEIQTHAHTTLSPGEIPNVIGNIEGGGGLFGSFARVQVDVFVKRD